MQRSMGLGKRALREMPENFEEVWLRDRPKMPEMRKLFNAGDATIERWIDEIAIKRAERIRRRK